MTQPLRVRFAPSPSGYLHVGGARTALFNWLLARHTGGALVLRIEDTDRERSTPESIAAILSALRWLGLDWDEGPEAGGDRGPYFQSERLEIYREHGARLLESGAAYRCFCTAGELKERRERAMAAGTSPGYDGRCGRLEVAEAAGRAAAGEQWALRFRVPEGVTRWQDGVRGTVEFDHDHLDDFIIVRSDGHAAYNLAVVVDDAGMRINQVLRGEDHISNTPKQIMLFEALGIDPPRYAHVPLIVGADGKRLSKRHGATSIEAFRDMGILPDAMVNHLALLGWSLDAETTFFTREALIEHFSIERINKSPAAFDEGRLEHLNAQHMQRLPAERRRALVLEHLEAQGLWRYGADPERLEWLDRVIEALGDRLKVAADVETYAGFLFVDPIDYEEAALKQAFKIANLDQVLQAAAEVLATTESFDAVTLEPRLRALAEELGIGAGKLFSALRVAVTGRKAAPGIFDCLALLGRDASLERLERLRAERARDVAETS